MGATLRRASAEETGYRLTLAHVREFLPRYRWVIAGVFLLTLLSAYVALSLATEQYEARATLLVKLGRENLDAPPTARNSVFSTGGVRREELGSEAQLLHSTDLLAQVVDAIGADAFKPLRVMPQSLIGRVKFYAKSGLRYVKSQYQQALIALDLKKRLSDRQQAIELLVDELAAEPQKDADVIVMRLRLPDPELAVRVQQVLIQRYLAHRTAIRSDAGTLEFLNRQANDMRAALDRAEAARNEWKQQGDLTVPAEQKSLLLRQIRELSAQAARTEAEREALDREMATTRQLIADSPETTRTAAQETPNPSYQMLNERLTKLQADRTHVLTTYQPGATVVRSLEEEIAGINGLLQSQATTQVGSVTSQPNPLRQNLQQRLDEGRVRADGIAAAALAQTRMLDELRGELDRIELADARLTELERDRQVAEQSYLSAVKRRDDGEAEARLDLNRISNVTVAMPPVASPEPVAPRKLLIMMIALVIGVGLGLALAIALEWASDAVRDPEQIESATDLVCLGSVSIDRRTRGRSVA
jgi:uncharacterized protein involved in exopolysaccharide biosynthesis